MRAILYITNESKQALCFERKLELGESRPLHAVRKWGIASALGVKNEKGTARSERYSESHPNLVYRRALYEDNERSRATDSVQRIGESGRVEKFVPSGGECLRESFDQRAIGSYNKQ